MPSRPTARAIAEQDRLQVRRHQDFRAAADAVADAFSAFDEVEAVALFGSIARPLWREVPRFQPLRRFGVELLHECKDVDLAIWLSRTDRLGDLGGARGLAVTRLFETTGAGVAHHQVDVFVLAAGRGHILAAHSDSSVGEPAVMRYLGRLCIFGSCPKGKAECQVPGCGETVFLRQHDDFRFHDDALAGDKSVMLYDKRTGQRRRACDLPASDGGGAKSAKRGE